MERVRRLRAFIYAAIAFAVLLSAALFSLSYAKWDVDGAAASTAVSNGSIGRFYVDYPQPVMEDVVTDGDPIEPEVGTRNSLKLKFSDNVTVVITALQSTDTVRLHIWSDETGASTTWPGLVMNCTTQALGYASTQITGIILNNGGGYQTGEGSTFYNNGFPDGLKNYYTYTVDLQKSGIGYSANAPVTATAPENNSVIESEIKYGDASKTVRHVQANGTSVYKNYICVSREWEYASDGTLTASSGTPTTAYVGFSVDGDNLGATVEEFSVSRAFVGNDGVPLGAKSQMRVYGSPVGKTLADINNAYVVLDFADGAERYYAMDISIVTATNVTFELTATAAHTQDSTAVEANKFYLFANNGAGGVPVEMSRSLGASMTIDQSVMLTLSENAMFKMFKAAGSDGLDGATWYSPANNSTVDCPQGGINAAMVTGASADYGNIRLGNPAGKYLVRYTANTDAAYDAVSVQMIAVERCAGLGSEVQTPDDGYYVVGSFTEFKIYDGCKMTPNASMEGFYEYTLPNAVKYTPVYAIARVADGDVTYSALNTASKGETVCYDAFADEVTDGTAMPAYRFVADVSGTDADAESMTLGYRYAIDGLRIQKPNGGGIVDIGDVGEYDAVNGLQFETGAFEAAADGSGLYYVDIAYESIVGKVSNLNIGVLAGAAQNIVSVTVHSDGAVNSFNINRYTVDGFTSYDKGHSYRITADPAKPTVSGGGWQSGDFRNWTGTLQRFADGELGARKAFGMDNAGYAIVRADGIVIDLDRSTDSATHPYIAEYEKTDGTARAFTVFVNGNAKSLNNDDDIPRIRKIDGYPYEFSTLESEKAKGYYKFNIGDNNINITFSTLDTDALTPITGVDKASVDTGKYTSDMLWKSEYDAYENSYFVFGQFTRWAVYPEFAMTASPDMAGYYTYTNESIITVADTVGAGAIAATADKYKIVYLDKTVYNGNTYAQLTYIGDGGDTSGGAPNITATDTTIYFDAFSGKPSASPDDFRRIIFDTSSIPSSWGGTISAIKIHYWNVNETSDYNSWGLRPAMQATSFVGSGTDYNASTSGRLYYFDIYNSTHLLGASLKGIIITFNQSGSGGGEKQSWGMETSLESGKSYTVTMNGGSGSDDNGTWKWHPKLTDNNGATLYEKS